MTYRRTTKTITLKELREKFPEYIDAVAEGQSFTIMKRSRPVFQMTPLQDEGSWETIADFTKIQKSGVPADDVLNEL